MTVTTRARYNRLYGMWHTFSEGIRAYQSAKNAYYHNQYISNRIPLRDSESYTKTLTEKKKTNSAMPDNLPLGVSMSSLVVKANPKLRRVQPGNIIYRDYYDYEIGFQATTKVHTVIAGIGTQAQYGNSQEVQNMGIHSNRAWFDLSPAQGQPAGAFVPAVASPFADWIGCSTGIIHMDMINLSTLPLEATITWFKSLDDQSESPLKVYDQNVDANTIYTTAVATDATQVVEPTVGGYEVEIGYTAATTSVPEQLITFPYIGLGSRKAVNDKWRYLAKKKIVFASGDVHRLSNKIFVNCFQKKEQAFYGEFWPKGSVCCLLQLQGLGTHLVIAQAGAQAAAVDQPALAGGRFGIVCSRQLHLNILKNTEQKYDVQYIGRGTVPIRGNINSSKVINDAQDTNIIGVETT